MKNVLLSAAISATLGLTALPSMAQNVDLRMSGGAAMAVTESL